MNTILNPARQAILSGLLLVLPAVAQQTNSTATGTNAVEAAEPPKTEADYRNWVEFGFGNTFIEGDKARFMQRTGIKRDAFGGIEDLHFEQDVGKRGLFTLDGRAIAENHDYSIRLGLSLPDTAFFRAGYREFRTWYDGSGGFFPQNDRWFNTIFDEQLAIDRKEAFFEAGLRLPDIPQITVRYAYQVRDGDKPSLVWGDSNLTGGFGTRAVVPSFWEIDEKRHIVDLDVLHTFGNTDVGIGGRWEIFDNNNSRNMRRRPFEPQDRHLTQKDGFEGDLFNLHASTETRINEKLRFTTGASYTTMDTDISGSRIYGGGYDPVYDPVFGRRQQRDEGFLGLHGGSNLKQYLANINLMWTPFDTLAIVPGLRVEKQDIDSESDFLETNVGAPPTLPSTQEELAAESERDILDVSESIELRFTGITNWLFYARGNWMQGEGDLREVETLVETARVDLLRDTDFEREAQKYTVGANWYPLRSLNMGVQYYHKIRNEDYDHSQDTTTNRTGNRYPAFLIAQDFTTDDVNFRVTWRPWRNVTLVSRYDFQYSTIDMMGDGLPEQESANITTHIFSQSVSWIPWHRLYLQGAVTWALDETDTPSDHALGGATNVAPDLRNNYWNFSAGAGLVLDNKTDLQLNYFYYLADNYVDNSLYSQPYGADSQEHTVSVALIRRFTERIRWSIRYGFFTNDDHTSGGHNNYKSHLVYSTLRVMF